MATLMMTVYGANKYLIEHQNETLFDLMALPEGIDRDLLIDRIILRSGEFEILYSNLDFMREAIGVWSKTYARTFERWIKALSIDYAPLENYDRIEEWHDFAHFNTEGHSKGSSDTTNEGSVSAYDASDYTPSDKNTTHYAPNLNDTNEGDNENHRNGRAHGNIGIVSSQQMLESELSIAKWNLFDHIADLFIKEFCICIY